MPDVKDNPTGSPPLPLSPTGHPLPRRTSPAHSVTLRHHKLARDASLRAAPDVEQTKKSPVASSPRRNSSGDSHETAQSDPKKWFDQNNENATATFDNTLMEVDPPFYQKESDDSNEERQYTFETHPPPHLAPAHSSSADDYRSVIDDLTVEIQKLKEELKRYKQKGPDMLRKEKLFEIKIHGLPKTKRRELEATLRDFTASLDGSPDAPSSQRKKSRHNTRDHLYSGGGSGSGFKHASSSSGSNPRPADSAYASMSTGANSSGTSLGRPSISSRSKTSEEKIESYLRDIPEGLYPRPIALTDRERKRLVVRRLEHLFTGKMGGRGGRRPKVTSPQGAPAPASTATATAPIVTNDQSQQNSSIVHQPPTLATMAEPAREARILPREQQPDHSTTRKSRSGGNGSTSNSNSNGDGTDSGNGHSSGSRTNPSPPMPPPPDQRPTRPTDLDPDRVQVPSENMDYIRHLGLVPPEFLSGAYRTQDVQPDAEGWVYLNLLCSLAQLHMINVTPAFVRSAVSDMSAKFQLSPDGRKIRWRGGTENTRFSSDSSGDNSQRSPDTEDTDTSLKPDQRKRQKTGHSTGDEFQSGSSSKHTSKLGAQTSAHSDSFHYKPMFAHQDSLDTQRSSDDTSSSLDPAAEESNIDDSRWGLSGSGQTNHRKRRRDGAIIYYSGAPFCTDLSGDPGDVSPLTYMQSSGQDQRDTYDIPSGISRPDASRSESGSHLSQRPLSAKSVFTTNSSDPGFGSTEYSLNSTGDQHDFTDEDTWDFTWSDAQEQKSSMPCLEPCGLGGVMPEDHFTVIVSTMRPKYEGTSAETTVRLSDSKDWLDRIMRRSSRPDSKVSVIECKYISGRIKRLDPVPLPPPAMFFHHLSTESSSFPEDMSTSEEGEDDPLSSDQSSSLRAHPHQSDDYPDGVDLTSGDEDGEDLDDEADARQIQNQEIHNMEQRLPDRRRRVSRPLSGKSDTGSKTGRRRKSTTAETGGQAKGSSAATAGAVKSGYSSSLEGSN